MAAKSNNLIPVLLLGGLALVLLAARQRQAGGVTGAPAAVASTTGDKRNAISQIITGAMSYLGGLTGGVTAVNDGNHSSEAPTAAALNQVVEAAQAWQAAYGGAAGVTGDPYNPE